MSREEPQINIRVSNELKSRIKARAKHNRRSMNAEIVHILQEAVDGTCSSNNESLAQQEADRFKEALLATLKAMQDKKP
ncbi:TPA: Arc family DNA-binding protein [Serratia marcescens]|nr:Arc family DNA-binding protein [Serratia marcescens]